MFFQLSNFYHLIPNSWKNTKLFDDDDDVYLLRIHSQHKLEN
jgi:hypothetical protein